MLLRSLIATLIEQLFSLTTQIPLLRSILSINKQTVKRLTLSGAEKRLINLKRRKAIKFLLILNCCFHTFAAYCLF
jgi:hypothetical protein